MDAIGINFRYLLVQCVSFLFLLLFSTLIAFALLLIIRSFRPEILSSYLTSLKAGSVGFIRKFFARHSSLELNLIVKYHLIFITSFAQAEVHIIPRPSRFRQTYAFVILKGEYRA